MLTKINDVAVFCGFVFFNQAVTLLHGYWYVFHYLNTHSCYCLVWRYV